MKLLGYTDRLSAAPGDTVRFMVSCAHPRFRADLVRLIHGDENPRGPGFEARAAPASFAGAYAGTVKRIHSGSYAVVPPHASLDALESFTAAVWIRPTAPAAGEQGLLAQWVGDPSPRGFALLIGADGSLTLRLADADGATVELSAGTPLLEHVWTFAGASYDAASGRVVLAQLPAHHWACAAEDARAAGRPAGGAPPSLASPDAAAQAQRLPPAAAEADPRPPAPNPLDHLGRAVVVRPGPARWRPAAGAPLLFAALAVGEPARPGSPVRAPYNGKLDGPRLLSRAAAADELTAAAFQNPNAAPAADTLAAWDFSRDIGGRRITDTGPHGLHGQTVNMPARGVTGRAWTGAETDFRLAPQEYGAIHFHADDLEDAGWAADFCWTVPPDLPSGVYAARLRAGGDEDYLPVCVRPPRGAARARVAVLMPTLTYAAYANFRDLDGGFWNRERLPNADPALHQAEYAYIRANGLPGLYERHADGSGAVYVSHLRPILNMRPKFRYRVWAAPARFPADLYLIDWLDAQGIEADVVTDHDLHAEGVGLLAPYRAVLTGAHPEYWTVAMLRGLRAYLARGGRLMYLGGNGFFGVTSFDPERPHVAEVRRWGTSWPFEAPPGERVHSTTGEPGGTWRNRGRAPQGLVGVGSCAAGFDRGSPYVRQPDSFDPRAAFVFDGVGPDERIGDCPSLMVGHGAAGYEMDRLDHSLGTPPHALLLASSVDHSARYAAFTDEALAFTQGKDGVMPADPPTPGQPHPFVRADMVYFETPGGGAVFSVGSIAWRGCLSYNDYDNNVSRITANVLRRFASHVPLGTDVPPR